MSSEAEHAYTELTDLIAELHAGVFAGAPDDTDTRNPRDQVQDLAIAAIRRNGAVYLLQQRKDIPTVVSREDVFIPVPDMLRTLTDVQEAVPGTVIKDNAGRVFERDFTVANLWFRPGYQNGFSFEDIALPARVLS